MAQTKIDTIAFKNSNGDKSNEAKLYTLVFDNKDSTWRAAKRLGLFWLLALASVPLIGAHWILVPGFLLGGPIAAVMVYKTKEAAEKAAGTCPECGESIEIKLEPKDQLPKWTYCPLCNQSLHITR
jgi:4-hydroxybenzoate polyprenyltransferase